MHLQQEPSAAVAMLSIETKDERFEIAFDCVKPGLGWSTSWTAPVCMEAASRCSYGARVVICGCSSSNVPKQLKTALFY